MYLEKHKLLRDKIKINPEMEILSIGCDSRAVTDRQLFFVKGVHFKPEYLSQAELKGACCIICENKIDTSLPIIQVTDIRKAMPIVADLFYENPSTHYYLTGITGTKGKTTCAYMLKSIYNEQYGENQTGLISTTEACCGTKKIQKNGTTPEALELFKILHTFAQENIKAACMEVSSQGLQYDRVLGILFHVGIFLNLGKDHISPTEHNNFEEYKNAKMRLFHTSKYGIINIDDKYGPAFLQNSSCEKTYTVSIKNKADFYAKNIILSKYGCSFEIDGNFIKDTVIELRIPGEFNIYNALCAIAAAWLTGCSIENIKKGLIKTVIAGRMQIYEKDGITVVVDYAHNELSFEAVFQHLEKFYPKSKIICLFACQGNKALDRRRELPRVIGKHADYAIITSDDPENEEPAAIIQEVEIELRKTGIPYTKIEDREQAVMYAIKQAHRGDVVFLAGKGQETTQKVQGKTVSYKGDLPAAIEAFEQ